MGHVVKGNFHAQRVGPIFSSLDMVVYCSALFMHFNQPFSVSLNKSLQRERTKTRAIMPYWLPLRVIRCLELHPVHRFKKIMTRTQSIAKSVVFRVATSRAKYPL